MNSTAIPACLQVSEVGLLLNPHAEVLSLISKIQGVNPTPQNRKICSIVKPVAKLKPKLILQSNHSTKLASEYYEPKADFESSKREGHAASITYIIACASS